MGEGEGSEPWWVRVRWGGEDPLSPIPLPRDKRKRKKKTAPQQREAQSSPPFSSFSPTGVSSVGISKDRKGGRERDRE